MASIALAAISPTSAECAEVSTAPIYLEAMIQATSFAPTAADLQITGSRYTLEDSALLTNALLDAGAYVGGLVGVGLGAVALMTRRQQRAKGHGQNA